MKIRNKETNRVYDNRKQAAAELNITRYQLDKELKKGERFENIGKPEKQEHRSVQDGQDNPVRES